MTERDSTKSVVDWINYDAWKYSQLLILRRTPLTGHKCPLKSCPSYREFLLNIGKDPSLMGVRKELTTVAEFIWFFLLLRCPSNSKVFSNLTFAHTQSFIDQTRNIEQLTMAFSIRAIDISSSSTVSTNYKLIILLCESHENFSIYYSILFYLHKI